MWLVSTLFLLKICSSGFFSFKKFIYICYRLLNIIDELKILKMKNTKILLRALNEVSNHSTKMNLTSVEDLQHWVDYKEYEKENNEIECEIFEENLKVIKTLISKMSKNS